MDIFSLLLAALFGAGWLYMHKRYKKRIGRRLKSLHAAVQAVRDDVRYTHWILLEVRGRLDDRAAPAALTCAAEDDTLRGVPVRNGRGVISFDAGTRPGWSTRTSTVLTR